MSLLILMLAVSLSKCNKLCEMSVNNYPYKYILITVWPSKDITGKLCFRVSFRSWYW